MKRYIIGIVVALCCSAFAAEKESDWQNLSQLPVGWRIEVVQTDLAKHTGEFVRFDDLGITLLVDNHERTVLRERVMRVSTVSHRAAYGVLLAIGGAVVGSGVALSRAGDHSPWVTVGAFGGMAAGAAAGYAVGTPKVYYRRPKESAPAARDTAS